MNTLKSGCNGCFIVTACALLGAIIVGYYVGEHLHTVHYVPVPAQHREWGHNDMLPVGLILFEIGFVDGLKFGAGCGLLLWLVRLWKQRRINDA